MTAASEDRSTMDLLRGSRITAYSIGFISLVAGLVLLFRPDREDSIVAIIIGFLFVVSGFGQAAEAVTTHRKGSYWGLLLIRGLINFGFGLALIFWTGPTVLVIVWLVGLDFVITGLLAIVVSFMLGKDGGRRGLLIEGLITIAIGIVVMAWPEATTSVLGVVIGIGLALLGLLFLFSGYQLSKVKATLTSGS
ncbi:MAG: DUF308 domain-containing protein [Actinomycetia bacterium]|nr:DUF308 domain-containing protein [Actinomycetes bacterium]